ncbi:MAG: hypothetical protein A2987_06285 [Omnitrophica bacterium RIFCSPLOWO2_01_FULL_45_10]|nr:MAG: hypothetical protein A2987_06285 [Omnitrophica bacterium RIFCSPLOWO2_01_FULL_45_10]
MAENRIKIILMAVLYILIFWLGFRLGEFCNSKQPAQIVLPYSDRPVLPTPGTYYIVETSTHKTHPSVEIHEVFSDHVLIKFLTDKNLRPLLKLKNIKIYSHIGERIY